MNPSTEHSTQAAGAATRRDFSESLVGAALAARRAGTLVELLQQRPRTTRWIATRLLNVATGTLGLQGSEPATLCAALDEVLRWAMIQSRPDSLAHLHDIPDASWLDRTSWRPMLAVASHYGYLAIPDFPRRYRRRADEAATDNLCGLWSVGPSTYYRYLEKGKRQVAATVLALPRSGEARLSLRAHLDEIMASRLLERTAPFSDPSSTKAAWHEVQAQSALNGRDVASALWHRARIPDAAGFVLLMKRFRMELASHPECDGLVREMRQHVAAKHLDVDLLLAHASIWQTRNAHERALRGLEEALRVATAAGDRLLLGRVYGVLGKYYESRDTDRALACLTDGAEFLRQLIRERETLTGQGLEESTGEEYVLALQRLAWAYVLRNDERSRDLLTEASSFKERFPIGDEVSALVEQAWGEFRRRSGEFKLAAEHQHRALNIFERLRDTRQLLSTYNNLSLIYVQAKDFDNAIRYATRVVSASDAANIEPYLIASALGNLGIAHFWQGNLDAAINAYRRGLACSIDAALPVLANRARYNLAEALFLRFQQRGDPRDEQEGDSHIAAAMSAPEHETPRDYHAAVASLKNEVLGVRDALVNESLLPGEMSTHGDELAEVAALRKKMALPHPPEDVIEAHLMIARLYRSIGVKELDAALKVSRQHGLEGRYAEDLDELAASLGVATEAETILIKRWREESAGVLTLERAHTILRHVKQHGAINKSAYATLCQLGLATASKHLGVLAERGLLLQTGKGPSTRYVLPDR